MSLAPSFVRSSIGKKVLMAVSGVLLFGFVVAHLAGNLLVYQGPEAINAYAEGLRTVPALLWAARAGLLLAVLVHIWTSTALVLENRRARGAGYQQVASVASSYASRTMKWSGPILALFIVYHLMHFTFGNVHPDFQAADVYHNLIAGFQVPVVSLFYVAAMLALGTHLYHGVSSMFQSLGLAHPRYNRAREAFAVAFALILVVGNVSFPVAVLAGFLK